MIFCKRRKKLIHRLIAEIEIAVGCVVQLRTTHCKNLFKKSNEELLEAAEAVCEGTLLRNELRPHLLCWPCQRQLNNFKHSAPRSLKVTSKGVIEVVKRCIEASPTEK